MTNTSLVRLVDLHLGEMGYFNGMTHRWFELRHLWDLGDLMLINTYIEVWILPDFKRPNVCSLTKYFIVYGGTLGLIDK